MSALSPSGEVPIGRGIRPVNPYLPAPVEHLPAAAREKLTRLQQELTDAHALQRLTGEAYRGALGTRDRLRLDRARLAGDRTKPSAVEIARLEREEAANVAELARLAELQQLRRAAVEPMQAVLQAIEAWLETLPRDAAVTPSAFSPPKSPRNAVPIAELGKVRAAIAEINADLHEARSAPRPAAEAKKAAKIFVNRLASQGRPDVGRFLDGLDDIDLPMLHLQIQNEDATGLSFGELPNAAAIMAWLLRPQMIAAFETEIDALADDKGAMTGPMPGPRRSPISRANCWLLSAPRNT